MQGIKNKGNIKYLTNGKRKKSQTINNEKWERWEGKAKCVQINIYVMIKTKQNGHIKINPKLKTKYFICKNKNTY